MVIAFGTLIPAAWDTYITFLQLGEEEQKALAGPVDLDALLTDAIVLEAWQGLDVTDLAKAE